MDEALETVVESSVDAGEADYTAEVDTGSASPTDAGESVVTKAVDAPTPDNNGEAIRREVERREAKLKQTYEAQMDEIRKENAYLDKQARIYGYRDRNEYKEALDAHLAQQEIEQQAQRMGVDPDTYAQYFQPVNQQLTALQQELNTYKQQTTEKQQQEETQAELNELYGQYPGLVETAKTASKGEMPEWFNPQMQELVDRGYKLVHAYELAHKDTIFRQREQQVLAQVTGRDQKQVLPSTDSPNNVQFDPANMSMAEIEAISARVRRGERIIF